MRFTEHRDRNFWQSAGHFTDELAANIAVHTVNRFLQDNLNSFDLVEWVLFDTHTESVYEAAEKSYMEDESDDFDF